LKVVVIDDEADHREMIRDALILGGYEVVEADNGLTGLESIKRVNPGLIICDARMPKMDGDELLNVVRSSENAMALIPFIFLSGNYSGDDLIRRLKQGADNCLEKPVNLNLLLAHVESTLSGVKRISNYMKGQLDEIASTFAFSLNYEFKEHQPIATNVNAYVSLIVNSLGKIKNTPSGDDDDIIISNSPLDNNEFDRLDYVRFFLAEYEKRKMLANTTNGEDLSWLLIFLVAKSHIENEKLPISDLYVSAPSAKSTINARINSLINDGIFKKINDSSDGRRQLISLSEHFQSDLLTHIDSSVELIKDTVL